VCGLLQVEAGLFLSYQIKKLKAFLFESLSNVLFGFLQAQFHVFAAVPNLVPKADNFGIAV
jgi:hypothetical protein